MVRVGAAPTRISRGWRACHGVNAHCQRFASDTPGRRCAHTAGHLANDTPLSAFVTEVVCTVGGAPRRDLTDSKLWDLRFTRTRA